MTLLSAVYEELPFLNSPDADGSITNEIERSFYALQKPLGKTNAEVLDETAYTPLEKMLVAYYASYKLAQKEARKNTAGKNGESPTAARYLKKSKAGSLESEFSEPSGENSLVLSASQMLDGLKKSVCETAANLGISLPMCGCAEDTTEIGFNVFC